MATLMVRRICMPAIGTNPCKRDGHADVFVTCGFYVGSGPTNHVELALVQSECVCSEPAPSPRSRPTRRLWSGSLTR